MAGAGCPGAHASDALAPLVVKMRPFGAVEVLEEVQMEGIDSVESLVTEVLGPLCSGGYLHALGVPGIRHGLFDRYPGPYLPRPVFLLHAYARDDNWLSPDE